MKDRISLLQKKLEMNEIDGFIAHDSISVSYLAKMEMEAGVLLVTQEKATLFLSAMYEEFVHPSIETVHTRDVPFKQFFHHQKKIGFSPHYTTLSQLSNWGDLPTHPSSVLEEMRQIKDEEEIRALKKAAEIVYTCYEHLKEIAEAGITELELSYEFEKKLRSLGASGPSFPPIIAFGPNTAKPHHRASSRILQKGDPILVDMGVKYKGYCSDMTRLFSMGEMPKEAEDLYAIIKEAYSAAADCCKIGVLVSDVDKAAKDVIKSYGFLDRFTHGLGHGIGLEVHEGMRFSSEDQRLEKGMVFTIEPGLYLPRHFGARYENMLLLENFLSSLFPL